MDIFVDTIAADISMDLSMLMVISCEASFLSLLSLQFSLFCQRHQDKVQSHLDPFVGQSPSGRTKDESCDVERVFHTIWEIPIGERHDSGSKASRFGLPSTAV